mmetsp:Transcript_47947/g.116604  ORF Transcript_47947/g.116604 Transcript_47947/m.116604 type:complete len:413 (-) Transcript_47947:326-1564(-)
MASPSSSTTTSAMDNNNNDHTPYSYSPKKLVESFEQFKKQQAEKVERWKSYNAELPHNVVDLLTRGHKQREEERGSTFVVAAVQLSGSGLPDSDLDGFLARVNDAIFWASRRKKADLVLLPELFLGPYFCQSQETCLQNLALDADGHNFIVEYMKLKAKQYNIVLPISLFERHNNALYNTVVMIDADGTVKGKYRKSHIPDGTGYQEKFYFSPGDTGFQVFDTKVGKIGVGICWDQWFPEAARAMALMGADILLYPTAIGSEPQDPTIDSSSHWQRVMQGHAAANMIPVVASNRYGTEILLHDDDHEDDNADAAGPPPKKKREKQRITFYGKTFITDNTGEKVAEVSPEMMNKIDERTIDGIAIITSTIDPEENRKTRLAWGLFRDRRPELYNVLLTKDGNATSKQISKYHK